MANWAQAIGVFGRLHPVAVHLPIGFLLALAVLEVVAHRQRTILPRTTVSVLVCLAALSAAFAAASGYVLSREDGYQTGTVTIHMRLGITVAIATVALGVVHVRAGDGTRTAALRTYRVLLAAIVLLILPTGHFGGTIAHGEDFLTGPLHEGAKPERRSQPGTETEIVRGTERGAERGEAGGDSPAPDPGSDKISYARAVAPIFAARCSACHGQTKKKGGLSLKDPQSILAGGRDGPVIAPGKKDDSELVRRLRLPTSDDDHMPPPEKTQPTEAEIATIEKWIDAGAEFDGTGAPAESGGTAPAPANGSGPAKTGAADPASVPGVPAADPAAVEALRAKLAHVEPLARDSNLLIVSFAAVAQDTGDAEARALLEPILPQVADLSLARSRVGDETMKLAARMPNLSRLDMRETAVTDAGVAALKGHAQLAELVIARAHLTDAAVDGLLEMPALKRVFVWNSGLSAPALARLRQQRPDLAIEAGAGSDAQPIETEKEVVLTKPAPAPGPAVNSVCPVTGKPVDPTYQIVFKGKVVGFCCPKCPDAFRADPAKFESKLP